MGHCRRTQFRRAECCHEPRVVGLRLRHNVASRVIYPPQYGTSPASVGRCARHSAHFGRRSCAPPARVERLRSFSRAPNPLASGRDSGAGACAPRGRQRRRASTWPDSFATSQSLILLTRVQLRCWHTAPRSHECSWPFTLRLDDALDEADRSDAGEMARVLGHQYQKGAKMSLEEISLSCEHSSNFHSPVFMTPQRANVSRLFQSVAAKTKGKKCFKY